ncbi:glycerate kinase [Desulfovibrio sp. OttesenSCG-928-G15]|nr:glycerate kinase [Desulfovibrio sp. OttesenSCG-928-G15]
MHVLIAPDSFKGSLSAIEAAQCMERGVRAVFPDATCTLAPIADGGEGTVDALVAATGGSLHGVTVRGPLGEPLEAFFGLFDEGRSAVVEMAAASGLPLLEPSRRNPLVTCTFGTGELIKAALQALHKKDTGEAPTLIIGIGGSATNDGGVGALRALGARFLDAQGKELAPGGADLARLDSIDCSGLDPLLAKTAIRVACDVDTPLAGARGASAVFGPQKGASPEMVAALDAALSRYAIVAAKTTGKDVAEVPGAGAAGGLGAGLLFFTPATLEPGVNIVLDAIGFAQKAAKADLVFTGEGASDVQTAYGKAPVGVAKIAKQHNKPVICISGALGQGVEAVFAQGIDSVFSAVRSIATLDDCMKNAAPMLEDATIRVCRAIRVGQALAG